MIQKHIGTPVAEGRTVNEPSLSHHFGGTMNHLTTAALFAILMYTGCSDPQSAGPSSSNGMEVQRAEAAFLKEILLQEQTLLTEPVKEGLLYMREEEKVARDIYAAFAAQYSARIFSNITKSEQQHMDAIKILLDRYEIADPVGTQPAGVFSNTALQELYNTLLEQGSRSLADALLVGKLIEETDIADLDVHRAEVGADTDIYMVYSNLRRGSENHLRAFTR
jgi:hypothetical protein